MSGFAFNPLFIESDFIENLSVEITKQFLNKSLNKKIVKIK